MDVQDFRNARQQFHQTIRPLQENLHTIAASASSASPSSSYLTTTKPTDSSSFILLISLTFFLAQYAIAWSICFRRWRGNKRLRACSSCISFVHGLVASALSIHDLFTSPWNLDALNTSFQNKIMEWSISFFIVDSLHYLAAAPTDYLTLAHHIATLTYALSCRYFSHAGAKSVLCLLAAGESTKPIQAVWTLALLRKDDSRLADKIYTILSPVFTISFTVVRGVAGPYLLWELLKFSIYGRRYNVPVWLTVFWTVKVAAGVVGSAVWGYRLWSGLIKFYLQRVAMFRRASRRNQE